MRDMHAAGFSYADIAGAIGVSKGSVSQLISAQVCGCRREAQGWLSAGAYSVREATSRIGPRLTATTTCGA